MSRPARRSATAAAALVAACSLSVAATPVAAQAGTTSATSCRVVWGSLQKTVALESTAMSSLATDLRTGHHTCYDRVVVEVDGAVGMSLAAYVPEQVVPGKQVIALASQTGLVPPKAPFEMRSTGLRTVPGLIYGGTEDGIEVIGVVTRARLPFRLFVVKGPRNHNRLVVDVAHRW